jgi:hypothetical protein
MASRQQRISKASPYLRGACVASRLAFDHPSVDVRVVDRLDGPRTSATRSWTSA